MNITGQAAQSEDSRAGGPRGSITGQAAQQDTHNGEGTGRAAT